VTLGMCVINAAQAAAYIGEAVLMMRAATVNCPDGDAPAAACSADVSNVLQAFLLIMAYISNAAALCGETLIVGAECSNRIESIMAGLAEIAGGGSGSALDCVSNPTDTRGNSRYRFKTR